MSASGTVRAIVQLLVNKSVVLAKDDVEAQIIIGIRLPRILLGLLCGCALATAGAGLQALLSNPLVSPDTLGIASGASFGAALALLLDQRLLIVQLSALAFGLAALYLTYQAGKMKRQHSMVMLVLAGVMVSALFQAMVSLIKYTQGRFGGAAHLPHAFRQRQPTGYSRKYQYRSGVYVVIGYGCSQRHAVRNTAFDSYGYSGRTVFYHFA